MPSRSAAYSSRSSAGRSVKPYQPKGLWEELAGGAGEGSYVQETGSGLYRRGLYTYRKRTVPHPAMTTFDAPSREICQVKRSRHQHAAAGAGVAQRRHLRRGGPAPGGTHSDSREAVPPADRLTYAFRRATAGLRHRGSWQVLLRGLDHYCQDFRTNRGTALRLIRHGASAPNEQLHPSSWRPNRGSERDI